MIPPRLIPQPPLTQLQAADVLGIGRSALSNALNAGWARGAKLPRARVNLAHPCFLKWAKRNPYKRRPDGTLDEAAIPREALRGVWRDDPDNREGDPVFDLRHPSARIYYLRAGCDRLVDMLLEIDALEADPSTSKATLAAAWKAALAEYEATDEFAEPSPAPSRRTRPRKAKP